MLTHFYPPQTHIWMFQNYLLLVTGSLLATGIILRAAASGASETKVTTSIKYLQFWHVFHTLLRWINCWFENYIPDPWGVIRGLPLENIIGTTFNGFSPCISSIISLTGNFKSKSESELSVIPPLFSIVLST